MKAFLVGLLVLGTFSAFAHEASQDQCGVKLVVKKFFYDDGTWCGDLNMNPDHKACNGFYRRRELRTKRRQISVRNYINKSLGENMLHLTNDQENSSFTLEVDSKLREDGWEFYTSTTLLLKNSEGQVIEKVSGDSKSVILSVRNHRYAIRGRSFKKQMGALKNALTKLQTKCVGL